jgi:predicted NUDIX family NTP pyrophosphohydrolase
MQEKSAGILIYRFNNKNEVEVLLGKMGGPYWANRNSGVWNIPKGHVEPGENLLECALREFQEETSLIIPENKILELTYLGEAKTSGNKKIVHIFALKHDFNPEGTAVEIRSNTCQIEFPPKSGNIIDIPELSEAKYVNLSTAYKLIFSYQKYFLDKLQTII